MTDVLYVNMTSAHWEDAVVFFKKKQRENGVKEKNQYIGDVLACDVYNYTNMRMNYTWQEGRKEIRESILVSKLRKCLDGQMTFHLPAAVMGSFWFAHHGMYGTAVATDILKFALLQMILRGSAVAGAGLWIFLMILSGMIAVPAYYRYIHRRIGERGMLGRNEMQDDSMGEDLRLEGQPSKMGICMYVVLRIFFMVACHDLISTIILFNI